MTPGVTPFSLKDAPALIERLLPVQKLSAEAFKEQEARQSKTLTPLGSYWKGRKPLVLCKACIIGSLLPATEDSTRDLEIFEKLMAMDDESFVARWPRRYKPKELLANLSLARVADYFISDSPMLLPESAPVDWSRTDLNNVKVYWREDVPEKQRRQLEVQMLPKDPYRKRVEVARRPEEVMDTVHLHIWEAVNTHLGTNARSFPELVEQLGIMRFGHRPRVADTFCGSGQIPFEAARLGCDVYASDLNPRAGMLTWGAFNVIGGSQSTRSDLASKQAALATQMRTEVDRLGIETDNEGWRVKVLVYCVEARCPQTGWLVPALPTLVVSKGYRVVARLVPDHMNKRYGIEILSGVTDAEMAAAEIGTVQRDARYSDAFLVHDVGGTTYRTKFSTLRGDYELPDGTIANSLRHWDLGDITPREGDILQERLLCIQWIRPSGSRQRAESEFRAVSAVDLNREKEVEDYVRRNLSEWQRHGLVPDMRIEVGGPPRYQGLDLVRGRGWRYWHHIFNPRQLLIASILNSAEDARLKFALTQVLNLNSRLSGFDNSLGGAAATKGAFVNQALNTLFYYGCRGTEFLLPAMRQDYPSYPLSFPDRCVVENKPAHQVSREGDLFITDPPYGDAVKYEEILDFFIAWMRRNPPSEFANWSWDSRRTLAIKGDGEDFRRDMVTAYSRLTECMPDNGLQVIMFTHQSGSIWADMANIVWASGLHVTAAWYVVTETDSPLRVGSFVKGTVLLICRKRSGSHRTTRDDLAWEIQEEVEKQVRDLTGLNQDTKGLYRDENVFEDADIQMAGYAAALRVLTRYTTIDGRDMPTEAIRPRVKGETTFVDGLIEFAVSTANQCLVPQGIPKQHWDRLLAPERFYLKLIELEAKGLKTLDNYQNFAKAFKVKDMRPLMASQKANESRLKSAVEFGKTEMSEGSEMHQSVLRAVLFAMMELVKDVDGAQVLAHLTLNVPDYYANQVQRELVVELADYLATKLEVMRPEEASAARVLRELVRNQRLG